MAEKTEFLQAIDDAILDADSLERFINGSDNETVLTRLSAKYPTLQKAIKQMFENGGLPATPFKTKALMESSELDDGSYAQVTDDGDNNGLYVKTTTGWTASAYDPVQESNKYADRQIANSIYPVIRAIGGGGDIVALLDSNEQVVASIDQNGNLHLKSLDDSVQGVLSDFRGSINRNKVGVIAKGSDDVAILLDSNDVPVLRVSEDGGVYARGITKDLQTEINDLKSEVYKNLDEYSKSISSLESSMSEPYKKILHNAKSYCERVSPVPKFMAQQSFSISPGWVNRVSAELLKPSDRVPMSGYDPSFRDDIGVVHPYAIEFSEKVAGYRYWMGINPYTNGNENIEIPFIYGTNDPEMRDWSLIPSFPQPFEHDPVDEDGSYRGHLSDPGFCYDPVSGDLVYYWRRSLYFNRDTGVLSETGVRASSFDGKSWSPNFDIIPMQSEEDSRLLSPAIVYDPVGELYYLYSISGKNQLYYRTSKTLRGAVWSEMLPCNVTGNPDRFWHLEVKCVGDKVVALFHIDEQSAIKGTPDGFYFAVSSDFVSFTCSDKSVATNMSPGLYKASFLPHIANDMTASFTLLYTSDHQSSPKYQFYVTKTNSVNLGE